MDLLVGSAILVVGLIFGGFISWIWARGRIALQVQAAVSQTLAASQVQTAQLEERLRATTDELKSLRDSRELAEREYSSLRAEFDKKRDEQARLEERSSHVPGLQAEIQRLNELVHGKEEELRTVATSEAQKQQLVASLTSRVAQVETETRELTGRLASRTSALQEANERRAALEEQAARLPALESSISKLEDQVRRGEEEVRRVSTSEAQKQQLAESLTSQVDQLGSECRSLSEKLKVTVATLQDANERKAALEEQASRIPELEHKLASAQEHIASVSGQLTELRESSGRQNGKLAAELAAEQEAATLVRNQLATEKSARITAEGTISQLTSELTQLRTQADADRENAEEKLHLLMQAKQALGDQFKSLATEILEEKSKRFAEQNQVNLGQLLEPLKTRLTEFQGKVEEVYVQEGKDRSALSEQVKQLVAMNQVLSEDAKNLTSALKGSSKTQGNWGELILERVLEASGLRKGEEYVVQDSQTREDGSRVQPDVVINLPEERKLVVDSKVSLLAYERYASSESEQERALALRQHVDSVRNHIKSLSDKKYHDLYGKSLDFVLAFVPIEPAFMLAVTNDNDLFMEAWRRNVLLVSPSTLLFVVRTVAHLWRQEAQNRNSQEIARRGAELYDKLSGFVADLESVGNRIGQAQQAFEAARSKLSGGRGNVIRQAEMLRDLGVKPSKSLPQPLVESALADDRPILVHGVLSEAANAIEVSMTSTTINPIAESEERAG
ncbi:DNA recombination protein RmuC [Caballeronia sp. Lep1P3]|uniref:DNA recombination protein RmuC n=1 Tax=Caballeronia sp. Lep1P3 TaxID=2878150 RepID=UPI001FD3E4AE|nr:DNA recombination protein RmuC [Caballeronia sp. Lep1P3]